METKSDISYEYKKDLQLESFEVAIFRMILDAMRSDDQARLCALTKWYWEHVEKWILVYSGPEIIFDPVTGTVTIGEITSHFTKNWSA